MSLFTEKKRSLIATKEEVTSHLKRVLAHKITAEHDTHGIIYTAKRLPSGLWAITYNRGLKNVI